MGKLIEDAITKVFNDMTVPQYVTASRLESLIDYIDDKINALSD